MNCGGRLSQSSLKLRPSPNDVEGKLSSMLSKNPSRNLLSLSDRSGWPGGGAGGSMRNSFGANEGAKESTRFLDLVSMQSHNEL